MTIKPVRIQRKRTRGFNLQQASPNGLPVVYVGRPTKWGNPYSVAMFGREEAIRRYKMYLEDHLAHKPAFLDELKGKNLACFCPLEKPCHVDIILKILEEKK